MIDEEIAFFSDWAKMRDCLQDADEIEIGALSLRLRRMLIDGSSLLSIVNRKHQKRIRFPSSPCASIRLSYRTVLYFFPKEMFLDDAGLTAKLDSFLSHRILEIDGEPLSIRRVVKLVANNLGGVHFDHEEARRDVKFDFKNPTIVKSLRLAIYHIAKATSAALSELADLCSPFPNYDQFLGHYNAGDEGVSHIHFESHQWMEVNYPENTLTSAISVLSVLEPLPQKYSKAFLISFEFRDASCFDISLTSDGDFGACYSKNQTKLELTLEDRRQVRPIGKQIMFRASIEKAGLNTFLAIDINGHSKSVDFEYPIKTFDMKRCVLGARGAGKFGAGFLQKEICILSTNAPETQESIRKYFKYRYF